MWIHPFSLLCKTQLPACWDSPHKAILVWKQRHRAILSCLTSLARKPSLFYGDTSCLIQADVIILFYCMPVCLPNYSLINFRDTFLSTSSLHLPYLKRSWAKHKLFSLVQLGFAPYFLPHEINNFTIQLSVKLFKINSLYFLNI